jgi:hypothetical protein
MPLPGYAAEYRCRSARGVRGAGSQVPARRQ